MLETAERLTPEEREPATQQFLLVIGGLRTLAAAEHDAPLILDAFLLRSMAIAGWAASFDDCARCGEAGPHRAFSVSSGGAVCAQCRPSGSATPSPEAVRLMGALLAGEWQLADESEPRHRRETAGLVAAQVQWHLERGLRSLRLVER
jgi:DNA repair protein RecO (recombination protein O)